MALQPKAKPRWQKRLKNGYIQRETNSAGHLVYFALPLYSMDHYDSCTFLRHGYYRNLRWGGNKAPYSLERRRIELPDNFGCGSGQAPQEPFDSAPKSDEKLHSRRQKVAAASSKQGSRSHISLRDDPIEDGCALAEDADVVLPLGGPWSTSPSPVATAEDKEVADLVQKGLLDGREPRSTDIQLSDLARPEAYTIRYATRKRPAKDRRKAVPDGWEDLVMIERTGRWEEDWELV
jgi:hypothetical protein